MSKVFLVMRVSGQYEDFRADPMGYFLNKPSAKAFVAAAMKEARDLYDKVQTIWEGYNDEKDRDCDYKDFYKRNAKVKKLKSKLDPGLSSDYFNDVSYVVEELKSLAHSGKTLKEIIELLPSMPATLSDKECIELVRKMEKNKL